MNTHSKTLTTPCPYGGQTRTSFADVMKRAGRTVALWRSRARQRRALADLSPELLNDIGVSPRQAFLESRKPFWRA